MIRPSWTSTTLTDGCRLAFRHDTLHLERHVRRFRYRLATQQHECLTAQDRLGNSRRAMHHVRVQPAGQSLPIARP